MIANNLEKNLVARALFYRFLALMFHEPGEIQLTMLADQEEFLSLKEAAVALDGTLENEKISSALDQLQGVVQENSWAQSDLRVEYNRLFVGPTKPVCHPYESVYDQGREETDIGTVQGPSAEFFENAFAVENLEMDPSRAELFDHVAYELEFMYFLLGKAIGEEAVKTEYLHKSKSVLVQHLAKWLPAFGECIAEKSEHPFYQNLGCLLTAFIKAETELV